MAPIGLKLCQMHFRRFAKMIFRAETNFRGDIFLIFFKISLPKRVSGDPRHFIFRQNNFLSKLRTAVYPPNMAPIGAKLCQNAFQVIPDISFFDAHKHFWRQKFLSEKIFVNTPNFFSAKCLFWRSCAGLHASIECRSKIHCQTYRFQPSTTLGGGVKREKTDFFRSFGDKKLIPSSLLWYYGTMVLWYYDTMILWYYDATILRYSLLKPTVSSSAIIRGRRMISKVIWADAGGWSARTFDNFENLKPHDLYAQIIRKKTRSSALRFSLQIFRNHPKHIQKA